MALKRLRVDLDEITWAMGDSSRDINDYYLDLETGDVAAVPTELLRKAHDPEKLPEWERDLVPVAKAVLADDPRYTRVPEDYAHDAWRLMEEFVDSLEGRGGEREAHVRLSDAIHGRGAFRRFKDVAL